MAIGGMAMNDPLRAGVCAMLMAGALTAAMDCSALLGGFEDQDGYRFTGLPGMLNAYNAGEYGTANGGGSGAYTPFTGIPAFDQGAWDDLNDRYGTYNFQSNAAGYYVTKHGEVSVFGMFPHTGDAALALRNTGYGSTAFGPGVPLDFSYQLDARDFYNAGSPVQPLDTGDQLVKWSIWVGPGPHTLANEGIWLTFRDSAGNRAFEFGWDETYELRYRNYGSSVWAQTGYVFGQPWSFQGQHILYERFDFSLDLLNDRWSFDVFSDPPGAGNEITTTLVSDRPFGQPLLNLTEIDWHVGYGNEKSFFDDSSFVLAAVRTVPEPGTLMLMLLSLWMLRGRCWLSPVTGRALRGAMPA